MPISDDFRRFSALPLYFTKEHRKARFWRNSAALVPLLSEFSRRSAWFKMVYRAHGAKLGVLRRFLVQVYTCTSEGFRASRGVLWFLLWAVFSSSIPPVFMLMIRLRRWRGSQTTGPVCSLIFQHVRSFPSYWLPSMSGFFFLALSRAADRSRSRPHFYGYATKEGTSEKKLCSSLFSLMAAFIR